LRALFRQTAIDRDLDDEIRLHLELETEKNLRAGMSPAAARRKATLDFGGVERTKEAHRDGWGVRWLLEPAADARYALRHIRHSPGFAAAVILTLAFGIGANTAMFSVLNALVLRQLPIKNPRALISISGRTVRGGIMGTPIPLVAELAESGPLENVCGYNLGHAMFPTVFEVGDQPTNAIVAHVTGQCFKAFGVAPMLGRLIDDSDAPLMTRGNRVAVISHRFWVRAFGADSDALGRTISANGVTLRIVGILPAGFAGLDVDAGDDVFVPYDTIIPAPNNRRPFATNIIGRLRPGVSFNRAAAELRARWHALLVPVVPSTLPAGTRAALLAAHPEIERAGTGLSDYRKHYAEPLTLILALTGLLLFLACVNLGGLLLARLSARRTELAIRLALGGSRRRVAQQMLMEGLLLSLSGAVLAVPVAFAAIEPLATLIPAVPTGRMMSFRPDLRVLAMTALVGVVTGLLMSLLPIWVALHRPALLRPGAERTVAGSSRRWMSGLLIVQVTLSFALVIGAGLMARSLYLLQHVDLGVRTENVLSVSVEPVPEGYRDIHSESYYPALVERLSALPGVRSVGLAEGFPRAWSVPRIPVRLAADSSGDRLAHTEFAVEGFFRTLGIPLLFGRLPAWSDCFDTPHIAVLSESLAHALAPDDNISDLLGRELHTGGFGARDVTIVGIVGNATHGDPREVDPFIVYEPALQERAVGYGETGLYPRLVIATNGGSGTNIAAGIRKLVKDGGYEYVEDIAPLADVIAQAPSDLRMSATLANAIGGLAALLALIGIYGALAYAVSRRTREIGVRMALGAAPTSIARMVLREGLVLTLAGIVIGLPLAFAAGRALRSLMFGITASDAFTFVSVSAFFIVLAFAAGFFPARRATKVDPMIALRAE
jgi:predicted permease